MMSWVTVVMAGAYLLGLLSTGVTEAKLLGGLSATGVGVLLLAGIASVTGPRHWRTGPTRQQWWTAGAIALVGASYCVAMSPQPDLTDVSRMLDKQEMWVKGKVMEIPQTSRNNRGKFFVEAQFVRSTDSKGLFQAPRKVSGKLYVTAPLSPSKQLYPGELIDLKGRLERIEEKEERTGFGDYLSRKGCFAKFQARWIEFLPNQEPPQWALWKLRERIVRSQGRRLGEPVGNLLSAMTLGRKAVDLPYTVQDSFINAGLAHTLAASGFHVALLLTLVLWILRRQSREIQSYGGFLSLMIYVGLTGLQPSVVRASVMGGGALLGLSLNRKVRPLGGLLMAVVLILLFNPQWIWDVGFQLSVMATLGLIVSVPRLMRYLDRLPTRVSGLLAVPIAAYFWTMPLQLLYFEGLPIYSVLLNAIATPLVILISMGGFVSAIITILWPWLGSMIAFTLYYPIRMLIWLVEQFNRLPGNSVEITGVQSWHVVVAYSLYGAICVYLWRQDRKKATLSSEDIVFSL